MNAKQHDYLSACWTQLDCIRVIIEDANIDEEERKAALRRIRKLDNALNGIYKAHVKAGMEAEMYDYDAIFMHYRQGDITKEEGETYLAKVRGFEFDYELPEIK